MAYARLTTPDIITIREGQVRSLSLELVGLFNHQVSWSYYTTVSGGTAQNSDIDGASGSGSMMIVSSFPQTEREPFSVSASQDDIQEAVEIAYLVIQVNGTWGFSFEDGSNYKTIEIQILDDNLTTGGTSNDTLRGTSAAEVLTGAAGNDTYHLTQGDTVVELAGGGVEWPYKKRYGNWINGQFVEPKAGKYFQNVTPISNEVLCEVARSDADDVEAALDAAHAAAPAWGRTSLTERSNILWKIAERIESNLNFIAAAETLDNGKPIRETLAADIPLAVDHFRYFAGVIRAEEGHISEIDATTYAYHFKEPLGVVGQIIPWNFPILMAVWKIAPALAAGNCIVLKPAEQTPASILVLIELIADLLPPGVLNIVNGFGIEVGKPLAGNKRIAKIAFTGATSTGQLIMEYASQNIIPVTLELGGKSPNIFFEDVMDKDDAFLDKCLEGFAMFSLNSGEVCTCPSRALVQESIFDRFMERAVARVQATKAGNPLDPGTMIGAQASTEQMEKITSYLKIGRDEGAKILIGGDRGTIEGIDNGNFIQPTVFHGKNSMRIFQEEIFGPVLAVATFKDEAEALEIANDTSYGLGAGVWTRDGSRAFRMGRGIQAGRVWTNCYHMYPAHAAFGGYKKSGIGRENHLMMLDHYRQTKCMLVSYSDDALGFF